MVSVSTPVTDEQIQQLVATGMPFSVALLWWGPNRYMEGAEPSSWSISGAWFRSALTAS